MFDFMESARVQNSEELNLWREEIRLSLIQQSALPPEEMMTRREEGMADMINSFVETRGVGHRILGCSVPPFLECLSEADKRGCAHVVFHLVRSQLKGVMLSIWEREDSWTPPPNNRQEFFQQVNQRLQNKFLMRQLGWAIPPDPQDPPALQGGGPERVRESAAQKQQQQLAQRNQITNFF
jgi:hypothetical protein